MGGGGGGRLSGSLRYHHSESLGSIWFPCVSLCMILKKDVVTSSFYEN